MLRKIPYTQDESGKITYPIPTSQFAQVAFSVNGYALVDTELNIGVLVRESDRTSAINEALLDTNGKPVASKDSTRRQYIDTTQAIIQSINAHTDATSGHHFDLTPNVKLYVQAPIRSHVALQDVVIAHSIPHNSIIDIQGMIKHARLSVPLASLAPSIINTTGKTTFQAPRKILEGGYIAITYTTKEQ